MMLIVVLVLVFILKDCECKWRRDTRPRNAFGDLIEMTPTPSPAAVDFQPNFNCNFRRHTVARLESVFIEPMPSLAELRDHRPPRNRPSSTAARGHRGSVLGSDMFK